MTTRRHLLRSGLEGLAVAALPGIARSDTGSVRRFVFVWSDGAGIRSASLRRPSTRLAWRCSAGARGGGPRLRRARGASDGDLLLRSPRRTFRHRERHLRAVRVPRHLRPAHPRARTAKLQRLIDGSGRGVGDTLPAVLPSEATHARMGAWVASAATRRAAPGVAADVADGLARSLQLRAGGFDLGGCSDVPGQVGVAVEAPARRLARCVTVGSGSYSLYRDSHAADDAIQTPAFELLFGGLTALLDGRASTASPAGGALLDDRLVVVLSERGRAPRYGSGLGRDHRPLTRALRVAAGVRGGQLVSGRDDGFNGLAHDPETGASGGDGDALRPGHLGATRIARGGQDPETVLPGVPVIRALVP